jgi:hypothetical protein
VKNKLVPDPFYGLNNEAIIDIADSGREYYTFWFFTTFECALVMYTSQRIIENYISSMSVSTAIYGTS